MSSKPILDFLFELGHLRRIKHEGWRLLGVDLPDSVAEHSLRAAQIGYLLAILEKYDHACEVSTMLVFHDMGECRVGDIHKVAKKYIQVDEKQAVKDQLKSLDEQILKSIYHLWEQVEEKSTIAGKIAKDADLLEQAITAKEWIEKGYPQAQDWIQNIARILHTESAKKLLHDLKKSHSCDWWDGLKKLD